ncbi:MAG: SAM-dependent methyltransferase [bacterium]|nr:SAM-dependent methyltransferase [bacterium]
MTPRHLQPALILISAACIAYQVALVRTFAVMQWHHFAHMIISMAMLGFGASGALLAVTRPWVAGREPVLLRFAAWLAVVGLPGCFLLGVHIPFETFRLTVEPMQMVYVGALYLVLAIPFGLMAICIALAFMANPERVGRVYGVNMLGSGLGAAGAVALLHMAHPAHIPFLLTPVVAAGAALLSVGVARSRFARTLALIVPVLVLAGAVWMCGRPPALPLSEYKPLSYALQLPDARVIAEAHGPLAVLTAVESDQIRETPGQVSGYPWERLGPFPPQVGVFFDGNGPSPVHRFDGDLAPFAYLDYVTGAVAYRLVDAPHAFVIGAGGGTEILSALSHGSAHVTAVELDPNVVRLVDDRLGAFSGCPYGRDDVTLVVAEGRGFAQGARGEFDLIHVPSTGGFATASAGVLTLSESYLYTVESFVAFLDRLSPEGVLVMDCWLQVPPRNALKLFATAVEACETAGIAEPGRHLLFVRSWNNATICVSRSALSDDHIAAVRAFCESRGFDICHLPGMRPGEANQFTVLPDTGTTYHEAAARILDPETRDAFLHAYPFYVQPATDDRPFFFRFFKWKHLTWFLGKEGPGLPFVEWGYVVLIATVVQSVVAGLVFVLLPVAVFRRRAIRGGKGRILVYFGCLGLAYMALEIAMIQRLMLFLASPVLAMAAVLTAFLVFSGLGSLYADRRIVGLGRPVGGIAVSALAFLVLMPVLFRVGCGWPVVVRAVAAVVFLAPMAFFMGMPFPMGLQRVSRTAPGYMPWAWAVNGCASVTGASLAPLLALHCGFRLVLGFAALLYAVAALTLGRSGNGRSSPG